MTHEVLEYISFPCHPCRIHVTRTMAIIHAQSIHSNKCKVLTKSKFKPKSKRQELSIKRTRNIFSVHASFNFIAHFDPQMSTFMNREYNIIIHYGRDRCNCITVCCVESIWNPYQTHYNLSYLIHNMKLSLVNRKPCLFQVLT